MWSNLASIQVGIYAIDVWMYNQRFEVGIWSDDSQDYIGLSEWTDTLEDAQKLIDDY